MHCPDGAECDTIYTLYLYEEMAMKQSVRSLCLCALMTCVMCILSCIALPVGAVPVTLQTFAAALCGYILRPREAFFSALAYLLLGVCGLPVFSMMQGGAGMLAGPTGGFLMGLPVMAWLCALGKKHAVWKQALTGTAGLAVLYALGALHLARVSQISLTQAFLGGVLPFIVKDALSLAAALFLARTISKRLSLLPSPAKRHTSR